MHTCTHRNRWKSCPLPGASLLRDLLKKKGHVSKQTGRKPPRFGGRARKGKVLEHRKKYTGRNSKEKKRIRASMHSSYVEKRQDVLVKQIQKASEHAQSCWDTAVQNGLFHVPARCEKCKRGRYSKKLEMVKAKNQGVAHVSAKFFKYAHYVLRCDNWTCRHRLNAVRTAPWPEKCCHTLTLEQVAEIICMWLQAKQSPPSPRTVADRVSCSRWAAQSLLDFITMKTAAVAEDMSAGKQVISRRLRPAEVYEIDGAGIGKLFVTWLWTLF